MGSSCRSTSATATGTRSSPTRCGRWPTTGVERALAFFTSAYSSYSGCRQYREDLFNAQQEVGSERPGGAADSLVLQPSRVDRGERRSRSARARRSSAGRIPIWPSRRTRSRSRWRARAATSTSCGSRPGSSRRASAATTGSSSTRAAAGRPRCPGSSPTSSIICAAVARAGRRGRRHLADRLRLRPSRGAVRPRRRGTRRRGRRSACGSSAPRARPRIPRSSG